MAPILKDSAKKTNCELLPFTREQVSYLSRSNLLSNTLRAITADSILASVSLTDEERLEAFQGFCRDQHLNGPGEVEAFRNQQLLQKEDLRFVIERSLRFARLCEQQYLPKAEARFLERKTSLDQIVYSLLRVADSGLARELYLRIADEETDFATAATEYSLGPENKSKGLVGPVPLLKAHPNLAQRLRTNPPGKLIEPFQIEQWWVVARIESYTPAILDDATRMAMAKELFDEWVEGEVQAQLSHLAFQLQSDQRGADMP